MGLRPTPDAAAPTPSSPLTEFARDRTASRRRGYPPGAAETPPFTRLHTTAAVPLVATILYVTITRTPDLPSTNPSPRAYSDRGPNIPSSTATTAAIALLLSLSIVATVTTGAAAQSVASERRVAVVGFVNITGLAADEWIGAGIVESLAADLERDGGLSVVGRQTVSDTLERLGADAEGQGARTAEPDVAAGRLLEAHWVISGGYQRLRERMRITARIVDVATGTVMHTAIVDGRDVELFALQDRLAAELRRGLPSGDTAEPTRAANAPRAAAPPPASSEPPATRDPPPAAPARNPIVGGRSGFAAAPTTVIDGAPPPVAPETIARDAAGRATVRAVRLTQPFRLDGVLDEGFYETVPSFGGFIQQTPNEGEPSTERTEAWVFYDAQNVYVGARLWDSAPESEWVANEMQRDSSQLSTNDYFSVGFDTFYDRRNGVSFFVNPIGGFGDYEITDEGSPNLDWNPIWDVRTGRFDGGWTVEMEVPFKSLRFRQGVSQVWGMQLARSIFWKNERVYLNPVPISGGPGEFRMSSAGTLTGVDVPSGNRTFEIKPYAIGSLATDVNAVPLISNDGDGDFGFDVKYGVTENLTADFTYNTDFAQVEVDEQQVNLTRFSLFFPEKREFFLESRGTFDFGRGAPFGGGGGPGGGTRRPGGGGFFGGGDVPTIFFSRRIGLERGQTVPILGGGRLTGKVGKFSIGAVNMQTDNAVGANAVSTNFTVLRVKRDILRRSSIGGIYTGRSVTTAGSGSNEVYGVDGAFSFYDNVNFNGYYARTQTPGLVGDDASYQGVFTYNGDLYALQLDHLLVGDNFNPEVGFLRRDDFRRTFATGQYSPRPRSLRAVRQFIFGGSLDYIESGAGQVETRIAQARFSTELENSDRFGFDFQDNYELLVRPFPIASDVTIPVGAYAFQDFFASYSMGAQRRFSGTFSIQRGGFFSGNITAYGYRRGRIEITPQFSFEPSISLNRIDLPEGTFTATLVQSRLTYTLTPRMFVGGLLQYNNGTNSLSTNLRLRWEYQPGSELFVVYNDQRETGLRGSPLLQNRAFIVKFTRLFRF